MKEVDIAIIGGGPAGLAAAVSAYDEGISNILIIERSGELGGILNQCIHNGFGLHTFHEELTGPEYASRFIAEVRKRNIPYRLNASVIDISGDKVVTVMSRENGVEAIRAKAVVLAMGCRERPRGALNIPGYRPAGIYSAGTAQRLVNIDGKLPGRRVVILGSGDIGLIMARRMIWESASVQCVAELMPYSGGLKRNIVQCLNDYGIPLLLSHTVVDIQGRERVESVTIAAVDENRKPIAGSEKVFACDTLLLSCGLIPENELSIGAGVQLNRVTSGPVVSEELETSVPGIFACGNVLHVHDLVDFVSREAAEAGRHAAGYVRCAGMTREERPRIPIACGAGVRYTVPAFLYADDAEAGGAVSVYFRVDREYYKANLCVSVGGRRVLCRQKKVMVPGEMEQVVLQKQWLADAAADRTIAICVEETV